MLCDFIYIFIKPKLLNGLILLVWWSQHSLHLLSRLALPLISSCNVVCGHFSACKPLVNQALNRRLQEHQSRSAQGSPTAALTQPRKSCDIQLLPKSIWEERKVFRSNCAFLHYFYIIFYIFQSVAQSVFCCSIGMVLILHTSAVFPPHPGWSCLLLLPPPSQEAEWLPSSAENYSLWSFEAFFFNAGLMTVVDSSIQIGSARFNFPLKLLEISEWKAPGQ